MAGGLVGLRRSDLPYPTVDASTCWTNGGECRIPLTVSVDANTWPRECYTQTYLDVYATAGAIERYDSVDVHVNYGSGDC